MVRRIFAAVLGLGLCVGPAGASPIGPFSDLIVFGDSYSDPGNLFDLTGGRNPNPSYYPDGQLTDGDVWAAQLGADFASGTNFAVAGGKATFDGNSRPDFSEQISEFDAAALTLGSDPLTAVFFGTNDLLKIGPSDNATAVINQAVSDIMAGIGDLATRGLTDFLVFGLIDLSRLPMASGNTLQALTIEFNDALTAAIAAFTGSANLMYFDTYALLEGILADPASFGFTNTTDACLDDFPVCNASNADNYLFFDAYHLGEATHTLIAEAVTDQIAPVPLPFGWILLATGLGALSLARRRPA